MTWLPATPAAAATAPVILFRAPALATFQSSNSNPVKSGWWIAISLRVADDYF